MSHMIANQLITAEHEASISITNALYEIHLWRNSALFP